jgi:hypothetical protein
MWPPSKLIDITGLCQYLGFMCFNRSAVAAISLSGAFYFRRNGDGNLGAQSNWKQEWEKTLPVAEAEGQLILYGCCYEYDPILEVFEKKDLKIKVTSLSGREDNSNVSARVIRLCATKKTALKGMPSRLEPMVPRPRRTDFHPWGQASPVL